MKHDWQFTAVDLCLMPLAAQHVDERYVGWLNNPEVVAHTEQKTKRQSLESVQDYVIAAEAASDVLMWRILFDGEHIGNIRLSSLNVDHRRAVVALLIGETTFWGRGLGSRAIALLSENVFEQLSLHKLTAGIYETNQASRRAFEKAGFHVESVLREHAWYRDRFIDVVQMARFERTNDDHT